LSASLIAQRARLYRSVLPRRRVRGRRATAGFSAAPVRRPTATGRARATQSRRPPRH